MMVNSTLYRPISAIVLNLFPHHSIRNNPSGPAEPSLSGSPAAQYDTGRRALIVDDAADITDVLSVLMGYVGFEVVTADSAAAALAAARQSEFDIIISDIGMPDMNGYELVKRLRQLSGYEAKPMIALTGYSEYDDEKKSLQAGFTAHLTKPVDPDLLWQLLESL